MRNPCDRPARAQTGNGGTGTVFPILEAVSLFVVFSALSAASLTYSFAKRVGRKGKPPETGW